jgi:hypothetical protein
MKQYIVDLQSFRVEASTEAEALQKAEQLLKNKSFQPLVEAVEEVD